MQLAKQKRRYQKHLIEQLSKINEANKDLERKNLNLDRILLNETRRHVDKKIEIDHSKSELMSSQLKVSNICSIESREIGSLQFERDEKMASYDTTIRKLAKDKAR